MSEIRSLLQRIYAFICAVADAPDTSAEVQEAARELEKEVSEAIDDIDD